LKRERVNTVDRERPFELSELFFSTTDEKGIITACNDVFLRVSDFESSELLGQPHNIIRHPDMPRCVFHLLWEYLLSGRSIGAYVKNRAKNGEYYWVYALASPIDGGFLSVRIKPSSSVFGIVQGLYKELLQIEDSFGFDWRAGMQAAGKELFARLGTLGFRTYDDFIGFSLREEMLARDAAIAQGSKEIVDPTVASLRSTFSQLGGVFDVKKGLQDKERFFSALGAQMTRVALNASIRAAHLGDDGRTLSVISDEVSRISREISRDSSVFRTHAGDLASELGHLSLYVAQAILQLETIDYFEGEQQQRSLSAQEQVARYGKTVKEIKEILLTRTEKSVTSTIEAVAAVRQNMDNFEQIAGSLEKILTTIQFSYITGRTLTARIDSGDQFSILLDDMRALSDSAREEIYSLKRSVGRVREQSQNWEINTEEHSESAAQMSALF